MCGKISNANYSAKKLTFHLFINKVRLSQYLFVVPTRPISSLLLFLSSSRFLSFFTHHYVDSVLCSIFICFISHTGRTCSNNAHFTPLTH